MNDFGMEEGGILAKTKIYQALLCTVAGLLLFGSWYLDPYSGFWFALDKKIFYFFNSLLTANKTFMYFVAAVNLRIFDIVSLAAMAFIMYGYYKNANVEGKRWLFCVGATMLLSAVLIKQLDFLIPADRVSASVYFNNLEHNVNFVSQLSGWPAKDRSSGSFPGDHGIMLMIFACFMWKYLGRRAFAKALVVLVVFSLPRIMSGAHWFTDIAVGSLSVVLVGLSWILLSPFADRVTGLLEKYVPLRWFLLKRK